MQIVDPANGFKCAENSVEWKNNVTVRVADEQGPWRHQGRHQRIVPSMGVDHVHAVAVSLDATVDDVVFKVGDAGHGHGNLDARVDRGDPPTIGPAPAAAGHSYAGPIDLGPGFQIVERTHAIPGLHTRRGITAVEPPPHLLVVCAAMDAFDFAKL